MPKIPIKAKITAISLASSLKKAVPVAIKRPLSQQAKSKPISISSKALSKSAPKSKSTNEHKLIQDVLKKALAKKKVKSTDDASSEPQAED